MVEGPRWEAKSVRWRDKNSVTCPPPLYSVKMGSSIFSHFYSCGRVQVKFLAHDFMGEEGELPLASSAVGYIKSTLGQRAVGREREERARDSFFTPAFRSS